MADETRLTAVDDCTPCRRRSVIHAMSTWLWRQGTPLTLVQQVERDEHARLRRGMEWRR